MLAFKSEWGPETDRSGQTCRTLFFLEKENGTWKISETSNHDGAFSANPRHDDTLTHSLITSLVQLVELDVQWDQALDGSGWEGSNPMSEQELTEFLGPVPRAALQWTKHATGNSNEYFGQAQPPLSGHVGFYLGTQSFQPPVPGSTEVPGHLGIFPVLWHWTRNVDDSISQRGLISLDDTLRVEIKVSAKNQTDLDQLLETIANLPTFARKPLPH